MNRHQRRALIKQQHEHVSERPARLTPLPRDEWPRMDPADLPERVWASRHYLVQLYQEAQHDSAPVYRMSVCRTRLKKTGVRWQEGLTWDELQAIKREIGFGDWYGVEIYPRECDVVNEANMRHIWLMEKPLPVGWRSA